MNYVKFGNDGHFNCNCGKTGFFQCLTCEDAEKNYSICRTCISTCIPTFYAEHEMELKYGPHVCKCGEKGETLCNASLESKFC